MAFGFLNSIIPDADKNVTLYTSPANTLTQGKVSVSSKVTNPVRIRLAIREAGGGYSDLRYLEYNKYINYGEVFETGELNIGSNQELVVRCDHSDVSFLLSGETIDESNASLGGDFSGFFSHVITTEPTKKELYRVPSDAGRASLQAESTIVICNMGTMPARARIGLVQETDQAVNFGVEDYIEYEVVVPPSQTYTRPGVKLLAGERVLVSSSNESKLQFLIHGRLGYPDKNIDALNINASGIVTATSFSGNFVGTVTGDVVGIASTALNALKLNGQPSTYYLDYTNFSNTPTPLTDNSQLTNGAGFVTFTNNNQLTNGAGFITNSVTGDLSVSGNVSVAGTLTYEDVTNVDSIGLVTARSGISATGIVTASDGFSSVPGHPLFLYTNGQSQVAITSTGTSIFKSGLAEKYNIVATNAGTTPSQSITAGNVIRFTGNETGNNITLNISDVHGHIASGESVSITAIITPNNIGNFSALTIDGVAPGAGLKWQNGNAASASSSGEDVYTFTILKFGSNTNDYIVYGAKTNYA